MHEDQSVFLLAALRILHGELPWIDFFDLMQKPPGVLLPASVALLISGNPSVVIALTSFFTICVHGLNAIMVKSISQKMGASPAVAKLAALFFFISFIGLTTAQSLLAEPYCIALVLVSARLVLGNKSPLLAGVSIALAFLFRPTALFSLIAMIVYLKQRGRRAQLLFVLPNILLASTGCLAIFLSDPVITHKLWASIVLFNQYHPEQSLSLLSRCIHLFRYFAVEAVILLSCLLLLRNSAIWRGLCERKVMATSILVYVSLQLTMLAFNRSFFDHYLYELLPVTSFAVAYLLSQVSGVARTSLAITYVLLSIVLAADRIEVPNRDFLNTLSTNKYRVVVTDMPQLVLYRELKEAHSYQTEWYWQHSQEEAYKKAGLDSYYGSRRSLNDLITESKPDAILLNTKLALTNGDYDFEQIPIRRPLRDGLANLLGIEYENREVWLASKKSLSFR